MASNEGPVYILNRNKLISVILDINEYEELLDQLQDAHDVAEIKELKTAKPSDFILHDKLFSELGRNKVKSNMYKLVYSAQSEKFIRKLDTDK